MRRIFTLVGATVFILQLSAQQITNAGFEMWVSGTPQSWSTTHSCIAASTQETQDTTTAYQGSSSIKMVSGMLPAPASMPYPGFAHYGTSIYDNSAQDFDMNGVAFPYHPDSLQFAYRYTPAGADSATAFCFLYKGNYNTVATVNYTLYASASYQIITVPIDYIASQTPDSMLLTFYSGDILQPHTGSALYLDAVKFIYSSTGPSGVETVQPTPDIKIFPNPANNKLGIRVSDKLIGSTLKIYSLLGTEVLAYEVMSSRDDINISSFANAMYLYRVMDKNDRVLQTGKFTKE